MTRLIQADPDRKLSEADKYMRRAIQLAYLGTGNVRRNPLVGSVIVADGRIIGEGYYRAEGGPHAEIEALRSVRTEDRPLLSTATIYVSLEPCCIYGRTPPCSTAIIEAGIPRVVISVLDLTPGVAGRSVALLEAAGVEVVTQIAAAAGRQLAAPRNVYVSRQRPYIVLKWAESADGFLGRPDRRVKISNAYTQRLGHRWRAGSTAILVGTNTALLDRPRLDTRHYFGPSPVRVALDRQLRIPRDAPLYDGRARTIIVTEQVPPAVVPVSQLEYWTLDFDQLLPQLLTRLAEQELATLLVEGGAQLLGSFLRAGLWNEARIFTAQHPLGDGVAAPRIAHSPRQIYRIGSDLLKVYQGPAGAG